MGSRVKPVKPRILCVNCNICVNTLRRYRALELEPVATSVICTWVYPRTILEDDFVCEPCRDLAIAAVNNSTKTEVSDNQETGPKTKGHSKVCLLCGRSLLRRQSDKLVIDNPTEMQKTMVNFVQSKVEPRELTAPAIHEPHCQSALSAAAANLESAVHSMETSWKPLVEDPTRHHMGPLLHTRANEVTKALDRLRDAYGNLEGDNYIDGLPLKEKKRLKFIATFPGAKNKLKGINLDNWDQPASGAGAPSEQEKAEAQRRLAHKVAQLNAAMAALAAATADRENPDYETAELAMATIAELMPQIAKDTEIVSSDKDAATRAAMRNNLAAMCDAVASMCDGDGNQHGEPLDKFTAGSRKLTFLVSPAADKGKQKYISEESSVAQAQAQQLAAQAQALQALAQPAAAAELGHGAAQVTDDAQALMSVAQVTAASIGEERCRDALNSAVGKLQASADKLAASCQQAVPAQCSPALHAHRQLSDSLAKLAGICADPIADPAGVSPEQQERRRLQFVQSLPAAKRRLDAAAQQLTKPMACQLMKEEDAALLEHQLRDRLAQLNAAVAALAAATADRENPDYAAAEQALNTITTLMPRVVQDSRKLCGTKTDVGQAAMLQDIRTLCDAAQEICDSAGQAQGVADAAAKFSAASRNLGYYATPGADNDKEIEVMGLSAAACGKAGELLAQVQQLTEQLPDSQAAEELDARAARAADAAQALLTVAQATTPTISNADCQRELISAAEKLRGTASSLMSSCAPHLEQRPQMKQQVLGSVQQLDDSLDKLIEACVAGQGGTQSTISPAEKEKRRLKFINSLSGAKNRLYDSEQQLTQPITKQPLKPEDAAALEQRLSHRLAQLNAAIAALAAAKADADNPDYAAAEKAVKEISELMPLIVQDSRKLSSTKDDAGQAAMLDELRALCQASRGICEDTETSPKVNAGDFNKAASKLVFLVSPATADKVKEKQVTELSDAACKQATRHLSQAQAACGALGPSEKVQLDTAGARLQDAAHTLRAVTQATSPSISSPSCSSALVSAAEQVRGTASDLTATCIPRVQRPEMKQQVMNSERQLADSLDRLVDACQPRYDGLISDAPSAEQQEKQRLKFISSVSGAKGSLDAAEQQLKKPVVCQMMSEADGAALQNKLADRLARLNAAVAALAAATADRENPDYAAADNAVRTISELMPQLVQDSHSVCGTKTDKEQAAMLEELRALCDASRQICDTAGEPQGLNDAAAKFSAASGKLVYIVSPKAQDAHEKQVLALSAASCVKAGELLSQVQQLTEQLPDSTAAAQLDARGARAADAAQALLTVAQATVPTIGNPHCQRELISAAEKLRGTASELTSSCSPHLQQRPQLKQQVLSSQQQLADSLDQLVAACKAAQGTQSGAPSAEQQEKQRLKFISSVSGAKGSLDAAEQHLKKPVVCQMMTEADGAALQNKLADRLARLNAAIAALAAATADRENPDYAAADDAVRTISELMPQLVQDSHSVCGTKTDKEQAAMLEELRALCDASRQICDTAGEPQGLNDAAAKFSAASGKLVYIVSPKAQDAHEKQVLALSAASCVKAGELLSQVQQLTEQLPDSTAAAQLDARGACAADAAQALLTVAQATAPTIGNPHCQKELISAAEKLRGTASELTSSCSPHLQQRPQLKQQVLSSQQQLADSLDQLVAACKAALGAQSDAPSTEQQEKQRLKFISSVSGAKSSLDAAEQQLEKPVVCQMMSEADGTALQNKLADRLARLNAAVAALAAATADRENPDYAAADNAVRTISELMPQLVQESHSVCGSKTDAEQAAMLQELRALCDASRLICDTAGEPQGLNDAAAKFSAASGKLVYIVSPKTQDAHEKQVLALSAASCVKAGELLSSVQQLTEQLPDSEAAAKLDARGARAADAAQTLITVAQATAPTIGNPHCQRELISAAEKLRGTASSLTSSCSPHLQQRPQLKQQVLSSQQQLADSLDQLVAACKAAQGDTEETPAQREKKRVQFISSVSAAKDGLNTAEQILKEPLSLQTQQFEPTTIQRRLRDRLARLNAAVAALAAATADRERPDYTTAHRAVEDIPKLLREVIHDSRALSTTKSGPEAAAMCEDLRALCDATRHICDNVGQAQALGDAAAKFSAASGKMMTVAGPEEHRAHQKQVIQLSASSCGKAGELLSSVQQLTEQLPDSEAAALDARAARAADAAQALLDVAQVTASSISEPACSAQLISAAEKLRGTADELTSSCVPHLEQRPKIKQQVLSSQQQLADSLDQLVSACKAARGDLEESPAQQEKKRLQFINSVSGVKDSLDAAEQQLNKPLSLQTKQEEPATIQRRLRDRLARLNAAVAALAAATADRERPDYTTAHRAVEDIPKLLREVIHDSRALSATKDGPGEAAMCEDLRALCDATRHICDNVAQAQALGDAATKFSVVSGKMMVAAGPEAHSAQEKQVKQLSALSCGKASELLSSVQQLTEQLPDSTAAAQLDARGARAADAAQALLDIAQVTASSISEPACSAQLISAAEKLRDTASELTSSCVPHLEQQPQVKQQVLGSQQQLADSLDQLIAACKAAQRGTDVELSPQQEKQRLKFVSNVTGSRKHLDDAEQQMKKPLVSQKLQQSEGATLQHQLGRRLAQLNAAVAALAAATQDGKNPDYPAAERAVITITELMPLVVQDSHTLCGTKDAAGQAAMLQQLRDLCDASRDICDSAGQPRKLHEATAKLANASGKLLFIVSPEGAQGTKPAVAGRKPPPPTPARDPKHTIAKAVKSSAHVDATQDFLDHLRGEEDKVKIVGVDTKAAQASEDQKKAYKQFCEMIDNAEKGLKTAEDGLKKLSNTKGGVPSSTLPAEAVAGVEGHMEEALARAGVHCAALVSASYADKLDYKTAMEPTIALTDSVKIIVKDGSDICGALPEHARKPFVEDLTKLCQATRSIGEAAKNKDNVKKLNDAAISFGDQSVKLLRVVSCKVDPALEKEVISRAKAIGDTASRLALEASSVATDASNTEEGRAHVTSICGAGASCVDTAGKLVYTAKLIAPTIHHATCQDTLVSSADHLSTSLTKFSKTWAPLATSQHPTVHKLTQEAAHLEDLVERLRKDVKAGKFGKKKEVEQMVNLDSPLRRMTVQIIDTAKVMSEYGELTADQKKEYINYSGRLEEALRALDLANARHQRAPSDRNKRDELEIATQDLQMTLLQTRPARVGQEQNNIVDFRDFLQDLVKEAGDLQSAAKKNEGPAGKRVTDDIKLLASKISEDASRLLNPTDNFNDGVTVMTSVDDIMDIDMFGQECDVLVKEINSAIQGIHDQKAKQALRAKALPLTESCYLLRFATNSHIMATKSAVYDSALQSLEHFQDNVMPPLAREAQRSIQKQKKQYSSPLGSDSCARASSSLLHARSRALLGDPEPLAKAVTYYAVASAADRQPMTLQVTQEEPLVAEHQEQTLTCLEPVHEVIMEQKHDRYLENLTSMVTMTNFITEACKTQDIVFKKLEEFSTDTMEINMLKELNNLDYVIASRNIKNPLLKSEDIDKLLMCKRQPVQGTPKQLEEKLQQLAAKLSSMSGTAVLSVQKPDALASSLHTAADVAVQLASTARALEDSKRPVQCKKIEDAAHEMCLATYSLLKTSELVSQEPNHHDSRRKLAEACRHLNDCINKLVRSVGPPHKVQQECGEVVRSLQLQRALLQARQPGSAAPYAHCRHTLAEQRDVLQKLLSDQAMSREEFLKSMTFVASAVGNSAECAAQAAYLISASEKDISIGKEGIPDVGKLHKAVSAVEETCVTIVMTHDEEQVQEESGVLETQVQDLLHGLDDSIAKTKDSDLKEMLKQCRNDVNTSSRDLFRCVKGNAGNKEAIISKVMDLLDDVNHASNLIEHPDLVPTVGEVSADTQKHVDEVVKSSLALLSNTEELIKQVKAAPEQPETMKWVMFNKRKDVLDAFEKLLNTVTTSGQRVKLIEGSTEDSEEGKKSYVQKQFDAASRWLLKPAAKADVKTSGQQAVRNLIEVANKITEDLKGSEQDDMKTLVTETEQLLTECSKKYDQEQYSVLMERVRELKKAIERGVVTRVVQDFMQAEAPLEDLDLVADYEKDESKRKFLLEKKIAELLAHLGRVTKTARLIADTDKEGATVNSTQLNSCSEQAELLAPMLVKAAQQRVASPDDKAVIENYKSLLAKYAESLSKIRDLCDQSVDPMDFVQTASETMERMREESTKTNDPMQCAHTSAAITKLANRVIHVGMSSSTARSDPELQKALTEAQQQLSAATPAADTRASRMPDWKDTTAKILQATGEVESLLCGETIFKTQPTSNQPIYNEALNLHVAIRDWSSRDNEIVAVAKRMAVLMAKLSNFMNNDKQHEVLATSKSIVQESHEVARLAKKLAHECTDHRIKTNLLQTCERIPTISGQLKMLTTVKGFSLGRHGTQEDKEALDMLVGNAQSLMLSIQDVVKGAASASVKIMSQRGPRMKWVRKTVY